MYQLPRSGSAKITALVSMAGAGQSRGCPPEWIAMANIWRDEHTKSRTIRTTQVRIVYRYGSTLGQAHSLSKRFPDKSVVQFEGRWAVHRGSPCLIVEQRPKRIDDRLIASIAAMQDAQTFVQHAGLGKLKYQSRMSGLAGRVRWGRRMVDLLIDADGTVNDVVLSTAMAELVLKDQGQWSKALQRAGEGPLYEQYLAWFEDKKPLTPQQFWKTITMRSIDVKPDGEVSFWLHAGDAYGDHEVCVRFDVESRRFIDYSLV